MPALNSNTGLGKPIINPVGSPLWNLRKELGIAQTTSGEISGDMISPKMWEARTGRKVEDLARESLPPAWMLPPKFTTLEEQQQEIPEYLKLTEKKKALSDVEGERQKLIDERLKIYQNELKDAEEEFAFNSRGQIDYGNRNYRQEREAQNRMIGSRDRVAKLRELVFRLEYNPEKQIGKFQDEYKKVSEEEPKTEAARSDKRARLKNIQYEIDRIRESQKNPKVAELAKQKRNEVFSDIDLKFKDRLEAANKDQTEALSVFEEAKKKVKYRPPAGVALDARGVPITA